MNIPKLDSRSKGDLIQRIQQLAQSYTPEWKFTQDHPDLGSTAALIFADMMQDIVEKYNRTAEKNMVEFFRRLGACSQWTVPAQGYVQFTVSGAPETVPGEMLEQGVRVLAQGKDGETQHLVFTVTQPLYAVNSRLLSAFYENTKQDHIVLRYQAQEGKKPEGILLFGDLGANLQTHKLWFCARECMDANEGVEVEISFSFDQAASELIRDFMGLFEQGIATLRYSGRDGFQKVPSLQVKGTCLSFVLPKEMLPVETAFHGVTGYWFELEWSKAEVAEKIYLQQIQVASRGRNLEPDGIFNDAGQLVTQRFQPFDVSPIPYSSVYFVSDSVLHQKGGEITLEFRVDYLRTPIQEMAEQEIQWKHIMKKSKLEKPKEYDVKVQRVVWEYYNGSGWVRLFDHDRYSGVFDGSNDQTMVRISFSCPGDLRPAFLPAGESRCIRARILSVENYLKYNGYYVTPVVSQPLFSYHYSAPQPCQYGLGENCLERRFYHWDRYSSSFPAAYRRPDLGESMYFCFDAPLSQDAVRLLFVLGEAKQPFCEPVLWEYYSSDGWKELSCHDETKGLRQTGLLNLNHNPDFAKTTLFLQEGFWLRARLLGGQSGSGVELKKLCPNTTRVLNVEKQDYEYFSIRRDDPKVCMLRGQNVWKAKVFVDELSQTSQATAEQWIRQNRAEGEWDENGRLTRLWILWQETEQLQQAGETDRCYQLDRDLSQIRFGDGIHGKIPPESERENIRVSYYTGGGSQGNLPPGAIGMADRSLGMISQIKNPVKTWGGQDRETMEEALRRSAASLRSFGRACTAFDYEHLALQTQRDIVKVKCLSCTDGQGRRDYGAITLVVLLKNPEFFAQISENLRRVLEEKCSGCIVPEKLNIVPPVILRYHISGQISVADYSAVSRVQRETVQAVQAFFHPLTGGIEHTGWKIGEIPNRMMVRNLLDNAPGVVRIDSFYLRICLENGEELTQSRLTELEEGGMVLASPGEIQITAVAQS